MTESKNGGTIFLVTKEHNEDLMEIFKTENKPRSLTNKEKLDSANMKMHKEEIKERVKELKIIKSNLKKLLSVIYGNCTENAQTMLKEDKEHEDKSSDFDCAWMLKK